MTRRGFGWRIRASEGRYSNILARICRERQFSYDKISESLKCVLIISPCVRMCTLGGPVAKNQKNYLYVTFRVLGRPQKLKISTQGGQLFLNSLQRFKIQGSRFKKLAWAHHTYACTYVQRTTHQETKRKEAFKLSPLLEASTVP